MAFGGLLNAKTVLSSGTPSATCTNTAVPSVASDVLLLEANSARLGASIMNDSSAVLYVSLGTAAASSALYTVKLVAGAYYEVPFGYTGQIRGIWASANGNAMVGEFT